MELLERLKKAEKGSPELDLEIMKVMGLVNDPVVTISPNGLWFGVYMSNGQIDVKGRMQSLSTSLDAQEKALPDGWEWGHMIKSSDGECYALARSVREMKSVEAEHCSMVMARAFAVVMAWKASKE